MNIKEDEVSFYIPAYPKIRLVKIEITKHLVKGDKAKDLVSVFNLSITTIRNAPFAVCRGFDRNFRNKYLFNKNFDVLDFFRSDFGISTLEKYEDYLKSLSSASPIAYEGLKSHQSLLEDRLKRIKIRLNKRRDLQIKMINDECDSLIRAIDEVMDMT